MLASPKKGIDYRLMWVVIVLEKALIVLRVKLSGRQLVSYRYCISGVEGNVAKLTTCDAVADGNIVVLILSLPDVVKQCLPRQSFRFR